VSGPADRIRELLRQSLVSACPAQRQVLSFRPERRRFVAVAGNAELPVHPFREGAGEHRTFLQRNARNGHQRQDVDGAAARMGAVVTAHVNQLLRLRTAPESRFNHIFRLPHEGHDRAVRRLAGIDFQQLDAGDGRNGSRDGVDDRPVTAFAEVGYALDDFFHGKAGGIVFKYIDFSYLRKLLCPE